MLMSTGTPESFSSKLSDRSKPSTLAPWRAEHAEVTQEVRVSSAAQHPAPCWLAPKPAVHRVLDPVNNPYLFTYADDLEDELEERIGTFSAWSSLNPGFPWGYSRLLHDGTMAFEKDAQTGAALTPTNIHLAAARR